MLLGDALGTHPFVEIIWHSIGGRVMSKKWELRNQLAFKKRQVEKVIPFTVKEFVQDFEVKTAGARTGNPVFYAARRKFLKA